MQVDLFNQPTIDRNHKDVFPMVAEIEITYKTKFSISERPQITASSDVSKFFRSTWNRDTIELFEEMKVMYLSRAHRILGILPLSKGGISGTVADSRLILATALKSGSSAIAICHNHPSSNLTPSQADINLTKKLNEAAKLHEIQLLYHVILTSTSHYSFADEGLL